MDSDSGGALPASGAGGSAASVGPTPRLTVVHSLGPAGGEAGAAAVLAVVWKTGMRPAGHRLILRRPPDLSLQADPPASGLPCGDHGRDAKARDLGHGGQAVGKISPGGTAVAAAGPSPLQSCSYPMLTLAVLAQKPLLCPPQASPFYLVLFFLFSFSFSSLLSLSHLLHICPKSPS